MSDAKLDEMVSLMRELLKWSKFEGKQQLKKMLVDNLKEPSELLVYEFSDGERSARDIEKATGVSDTTVGRNWEKWFKLGIVEESKKRQGRMMHICTLEEVGIEPPTPPARLGSQTNPPVSEGGTTGA